MSVIHTSPAVEKIRVDTEQICAEHRALKGPMLPILNAVQDHFGYIPRHAVGVIAEQLNLSRADVHGVISFYHLYRDKPGGKHTIYLCRAEACQSMGGRELGEQIKQALGVDWHGTTADGRFTLEPIYCLGNCACAPALMIDETLHARVSPQSFARLVEAVD